MPVSNLQYTIQPPASRQLLTSQQQNTGKRHPGTIYTPANQHVDDCQQPAMRHVYARQTPAKRNPQVVTRTQPPGNHQSDASQKQTSQQPNISKFPAKRQSATSTTPVIRNQHIS